MDGFKTVERRGVMVSPGDRVALGIVTIDIGTVTETVSIMARATELQAQSAERSYAVEGKAVQNIADERPQLLRPRVSRAGRRLHRQHADGRFRDDERERAAGGSNNVQVDGVTDMDTGNNGGPMVDVSLDSVQEVKMLTSNYQAEYGRSAGAQISAVTKSGDRNFHGSAYWFRRNDDLNANTWINNRDHAETPGTPFLDQRDLGYTIGGPVLLPGLFKGKFNTDRSKLFFFWSQEYPKPAQSADVAPARAACPRSSNGGATSHRAWTTRAIRSPTSATRPSGLPCSASDTRGCFQDGGVIGRIPQGRLYPLGLNILKMYPTPNSPGTSRKASTTSRKRPTSQPQRQDLIEIDWNPSSALRIAGKVLNNNRNYLQPYGSFVLASNLPEFRHLVPVPGARLLVHRRDDAQRVDVPGVTYGYSHNAIDIVPTSVDSPDILSRSTLGLTGFPTIYPNAVQNDLPPRFQFGTGRVANAPNLGTNNAPFKNFNTTQDVVGEPDEVWGSHTAKAGFYFHHSVKPQSSFASEQRRHRLQQRRVQSVRHRASRSPTRRSASTRRTHRPLTYLIGNYIYNNVEWYVQDNWKVSDRLTLDYGMRFYWIQPQHDTQGYTANFLPDRYDPSQAMRLYYPGRDANGTRVAVDRATGQTLPAVYIGRLVPNSGNVLNGVFPAGQGIEERALQESGHPATRRVSAFTYDPTGTQTLHRARRRRHLLRSAARQHGFRPGAESASRRPADALLRPAAGHRSEQRAARAAGARRLHRMKAMCRRPTRSISACSTSCRSRRCSTSPMSARSRIICCSAATSTRRPTGRPICRRIRTRRWRRAARRARMRCRWTFCGRTRASATSR